MKILEIVHLRLAGEEPKTLVDAIKQSVDSESTMEFMSFYRRCEVETDLTVLILRHKKAEGGKPSSLGVQLASALHAHGLVEHTVWEEVE